MMCVPLLSLPLLLQVGFVDRPVATGPDLEGLFERVLASSLVAVGRVSTMTHAHGPVYVPKEVEEAAKRGEYVSIQLPPGGFVFSVAIERKLCGRSDLVEEAQALEPRGSVIHMFIPRDEKPVRSQRSPGRVNVPEWLIPGREYLLFLQEAGNQQGLVATYGLDAETTYYRTVEGDRGAVALPDAAHPERKYDFTTPLLEAVTAFCEAVKAPDLEAKIQNLRAVREKFPYPAWRESVDTAILNLQMAKIYRERRQGAIPGPRP